MLTLCAIDGLDMVNEEYVEKLCKWNTQCCLTHAVNKIDLNAHAFDPALRTTLVTLRRLLGRISLGAQDFICKLMQQRFTDSELKNLNLKQTTAADLQAHPWLTGGSKPQGERSVRLTLKELLAVSSDGA